MKTKEIWIGFDLMGQSVLLLFLFFAGIGALFQAQGAGVIVMIILFFTGVWQMLSVFLKALILQRPWQGTYLLSALAYLTLTILFIASATHFPPLPREFEETLLLIFLVGIPFGAAVAYFVLSWQDLAGKRREKDPVYV